MPASALPTGLAWEFAGWYGGGAYPMVVPDPSVAGRVYLLSDVCGIWRSDDRGNLWVPKNEGLINIKIVNLAVAPSNPNVLYAGTSIGIHRSDDAGTQWRFLEATRNRVIFKRPDDYRSIVVHPSDPNRVFAGTQTGEIFRSSDGGVTWASMGNPLGAAASALHLTGDGVYLFAGAFNGLRRCTVASGAWETLSPLTPRALDIASIGNTIYVAGGTRVSISSDNGASWRYSVDLPTAGEVYRLSAATSPEGVRLLVGCRDGWNGTALLSVNGGLSWTGVERGLSHDLTSNPTRAWSTGFGWPLTAVIDPFDSNVLYFADFWGVWRSDDAGVTWRERIKGAFNTIGSDIDIGADGRVFVGTMDNGLAVSADGGTTYRAIIPGAGYDNSIAGHVWKVVVNGSKIVATNSPWNGAANQILISENGGTSFTKTKNGLPAAYPRTSVVWDKGYARALARDPVDPTRYYLGIDGTDGGGFFYSTNGGYAWTRGAAQPASLKIYNGLAVDPLEPSRIYWGTVGDAAGGVYRTENYGANWSKVFSASNYVFDIAVDSAGTVYAAADTGGPALYVSRNRGTSWGLLKKFEGSGTCDGIAIDPTNPSRIAVSTVKWNGHAPGKIFFSEDAGVTWHDLTLNLPNGSGANAMTFAPDGDTLWISRDASSAYKLRFPGVDDTLPPSVPGDLAVRQVAGESADVTWSASIDDRGVAGYRVFRDGVRVGVSTVAFYRDSTGVPGRAYAYAVRAFDAADNESPEAGPVSLTIADLTAPSVPSIRTYGVVEVKKASLAWDAPLDNVGVTGYRIFRDNAQIAQTASRSYVDAGVTDGNAYSYFLKAHDAAGNVSASSAAVTVTIPDVTSPAAPTSLAAQARAREILVTWAASPERDVATYKIFRDGQLAGSFDTLVTLYADTGVTPGQVYSYRVTAVDNAQNESAPSAAVNAATLGTDTAAPTVPANLRAAASEETPQVPAEAPGTSIFFDGQGDALVFADAPDWNLASDDLTIDFWARFDNVSAIQAIFSQGNSSVDYMRFEWNGRQWTFNAGMQVFTYGSKLVAPDSIAPNTWYHLALVRKGSTWKIFRDGVEKASGVDPDPYPDYSGPFVVGCLDYRDDRITHLGGRLDGFRVTRGLARWDVPFTPPTLASDPDASTRLLLRAAEPRAFTDASASAHPVQALADVRADASLYKMTRPVTEPGVNTAVVGLDWLASSDAVGVTGYRVLRNGAALGSTESPTYVDRTVARGSSYSYSVLALDAADNESAASAAATASVPI